MTIRTTTTAALAISVGALALGLCAPARAQDASGSGSASASGSAGGGSEIELGATQASSVELGAGAGSTSNAGGTHAATSSADYSAGGDGGSSDVRLALQLRFDALNLISMADPGPIAGAPEPGRQLLVPIATPGVRLLDDGALFLGLGFGFANADVQGGGNSDQSQSGFSLTPLISYDVLADDTGALSIVGLVDLASLGETETCNPGGCMDANDDAFGIGLGIGAGLRGKITPGVAIGGEFGWGFLSIDRDAENDNDFVHGVFGNLLFEASLGL